MPVTTPKIFYGWWIVLSGTGIMALSGGLYFQGFGVFFLPILNEFGWSRTQTALAFSLAQLEGGVIGPIEGYLVDRLGPRRLMLIGIPIMGAGFILLSMVNSLPMFYVAYILGISMGSSIGASTPIFTAIANWFNRRRGLALGLASAGVGVGGVMLPALSWTIETFGWRTAAFSAGLLVWAIGIPAALTVRHRPEDYGLLPDGDPLPPNATAAEHKGPSHASHGHATQTSSFTGEDRDFTIGEALRTTTFWLMALSFACRILVTSGILVHLVPYLQDRGFAATEAAAAVGIMGVLSIIGRLGLGFVSDYLPKRLVIAGSLVIMLIGILVLANVQNAWHVGLFILLFGPTSGGLAAMMSVLRAEYFGPRYFATIQGTMAMVLVGGSIGGPLLAAWVFDTFQSYGPVFYVFGAAGVISTLLILVARPPVKQRKVELAS